MSKPILDNSDPLASKHVFSFVDTFSYSFTVGSGVNRYLLVELDASNTSVVSVKFNGVDLTNLGSLGSKSFWGLKNPASGAHTILLTFADAKGLGNVFSSSWTNVDQTTPVGTFASHDGISESVETYTLSVPSSANDVVVDMFDQGGAPLTSGAGQTHLYYNSGDNHAISYKDGAASSTDMTWSWTGANGFTAVGIALKGVAETASPLPLDVAGQGEGDSGSASN